MDAQKWKELEVGDRVWIKPSSIHVGYVAYVKHIEYSGSYKKITVWSDHCGYEILNNIEAACKIESLKGIKHVESLKELKLPCYVVVENNGYYATKLTKIDEGTEYGVILHLNGNIVRYNPSKLKLYPVPFPKQGV